MRAAPATEFYRLREQAGLDIAAAAALFKIHTRTVRRYDRGETTARPIYVDRLRAMARARKASTASMNGFRFIDLFAGVGGLRLAMEAAGGECVFTSEWDAACRKTYAANFVFDHEIVGDIRDFSDSPSTVPAHDVLVAGFPCQPFSIAGVTKKNALNRPHGFQCDTQGTLFFDLAQIIQHHQPPAFLLENVQNLERHDQGRTFKIIMRTLRDDLGYDVHYTVVDARSWVPQKRRRVFIAGFRKPVGFSFGYVPAAGSREGTTARLRT